MYKSTLFNNLIFNHHVSSIRLASLKSPTLYEILEIPKTATTKEIKIAYYKKCKEHHPDKNKDNRSHDKFIKIQKAYDTLSEANSRRDYDLSLQNYSTGNGSRYTKSNPAHVYQTYHNHHQAYYQYHRGMNNSSSEFDRFMRNRHGYYSNQTKKESPVDQDFSSPLKVMIYLILGIGIFEAFTVSWIYDQDINRLYDKNYRYSPINPQALVDFKREVENADLLELEIKIKEKKDLEQK